MNPDAVGGAITHKEQISERNQHEVLEGNPVVMEVGMTEPSFQHKGSWKLDSPIPHFHKDEFVDADLVDIEQLYLLVGLLIIDGHLNLSSGGDDRHNFRLPSHLYDGQGKRNNYPSVFVGNSEKSCGSQHYRSQLMKFARHGLPISLEVMLVPDCEHFQNTTSPISHAHRHQEDSDNCLVVEQWFLQLLPNTSDHAVSMVNIQGEAPSAAVQVPALLQAISSFLHFSPCRATPRHFSPHPHNGGLRPVRLYHQLSPYSQTSPHLIESSPSPHGTYRTHNFPVVEVDSLQNLHVCCLALQPLSSEMPWPPPQIVCRCCDAARKSSWSPPLCGWSNFSATSTPAALRPSQLTPMEREDSGVFSYTSSSSSRSFSGAVVTKQTTPFPLEEFQQSLDGIRMRFSHIHATSCSPVTENSSSSHSDFSASSKAQSIYSPNPLISRTDNSGPGNAHITDRTLRGSQPIFKKETGLPLQSSPAPTKRHPSGRFDRDTDASPLMLGRPGQAHHLATNYTSSVLRLPEKNGSKCKAESADTSSCHSNSSTVHSQHLVVNFEESMLAGRIPAAGTVDGFRLDMSASNLQVAHKHVCLPLKVFFFRLTEDNAPSPYLGYLDLEQQLVHRKGYHIPRRGTLQLTLMNPSSHVVKLFVVMYDLTDMPVNSSTFMRQRTLYMPVDRRADDSESSPDQDKDLAQFPVLLRYLIHLRFHSSSSGRIYLHKDIRVIFSQDKFEFDASVRYDLRSFTELPSPRYSISR